MLYTVYMKGQKEALTSIQNSFTVYAVIDISINDSTSIDVIIISTIKQIWYISHDGALMKEKHMLLDMKTDMIQRWKLLGVLIVISAG